MTYYRYSTNFLLLFLVITSLVLSLFPASVSAAEEPNYSVTWRNNRTGQYPLTLKSSWFKAYETSSGRRTATNNSIPISREQVTTDPVTNQTKIYVTIHANSFRNNRECEAQLLVRRPIPAESVIEVSGRRPSDGNPPCSESLVNAMTKIVEPDGDNINQEPGREDDPRTDTPEDAQQDRDNVRDADDQARQDENEPSCTERFPFSAGWIVCGILEIISDGITGIFNMADAMLDIDGQNLYVNDQLRQIWSYFRVVATLYLVIITLVMVISQAIGGGL